MYLNKQLIELLSSYAKTSDLSLSEYAENILLGGVSVTSQMPLIDALEKEIKNLILQNKEFETKLLKNKELIYEKQQAIKKSKKAKNEFSDVKEALDKHAEERKDHYMSILIRKIIEGDDLTEIKRVAIQHSALLNQKYKWEELFKEAMQKAGKVKK